MLNALGGIIDFPLVDTLFAEEILDTFTVLEQLRLFLAMEEEVHAKPSINRHALKELFFRLPIDDKVSDMVFIGKVLELRDEFVEKGEMGMCGCMDVLCDFSAALRWATTIFDESDKATGDVVIVCASEHRLCVDLLDRLSELVDVEMHGG